MRQERARRVQACLQKLGFGSETQDDVELCREFSRARILDRSEVDDNRLTRFWIGYVFQDAVLLIPRLAFDVTLRRPFIAPFHFDGEMNVAGTPRIKHRFDRAEIIFTAGPGHEPTKTLEIGFAFGVFVAAVQINTIVVSLPDFDQHTAKWVPASIQNSAGKMGDLADGGSDGIIDDDEVVIRVQGKVVRIKRAFGLLGCEQQLFREGTRNGEEHHAQPGALNEVTAILSKMNWAGGKVGRIHDANMDHESENFENFLQLSNVSQKPDFMKLCICSRVS
jgi:hypothetical protein